jgi:hypothetical protein
MSLQAVSKGDHGPEPSFANAETVDRLTQQLVWFLQTFHEEHQKHAQVMKRNFGAETLLE